MMLYLPNMKRVGGYYLQKIWASLFANHSLRGTVFNEAATFIKVVVVTLLVSLACL